MELDSAAAYLLVAVLNLLLGVTVGWLVRRANEPKPEPPAVDPVILMKALRELSNHVASLVQLKAEFTTLTDCNAPPTRHLMRGVFEQLFQVIGCIEQSASAAGRTTPDAYSSPGESDVADLATQAWFPSKKSTPEERRKTRRFSYRRNQRIAPYLGGGLPSPSDFYNVWFNDLSTGGFTFISPDRVRFTQLVARLGNEPNVVPVVARILRHEKLEDGFLVGCEIIRRLDENDSDVEIDSEESRKLLVLQ